MLTPNVKYYSLIYDISPWIFTLHQNNSSLKLINDQLAVKKI
jgi:hypothetical protein